MWCLANPSTAERYYYKLELQAARMESMTPTLGTAKSTPQKDSIHITCGLPLNLKIDILKQFEMSMIHTVW